MLVTRRICALSCGDSLSASGYTVIEVVDRAESVAKEASERLDLVFMDAQLPVRDAYDATCQIKALPVSQQSQSLPSVPSPCRATRKRRGPLGFMTTRPSPKAQSSRCVHSAESSLRKLRLRCSLVARSGAIHIVTLVQPVHAVFCPANVSSRHKADMLAHAATSGRSSVVSGHATAPKMGAEEAP